VEHRSHGGGKRRLPEPDHEKARPASPLPISSERHFPGRRQHQQAVLGGAGDGVDRDGYSWSAPATAAAPSSYHAQAQQHGAYDSTTMPYYYDVGVGSSTISSHQPGQLAVPATAGSLHQRATLEAGTAAAAEVQEGTKYTMISTKTCAK
jgi:hypothetical protein